MSQAAPTLSTFNDSAAFKRHAEAFMLQHEAGNTVPIGLLTAMVAGNLAQAAPPFLATVRDGGAVIGAFVRTPPYRLIISDGTAAQSLPLLVAHLAATTPDLTGVTGPVPLAMDFASQWTAATGTPHRAAHHLRLYAATAIVPPPPPPGVLRAAAPTDRERVIDWFLAFHEDAHLDQAMTRDTITPLVLNRLAAGNPAVWFWEVAGEPVAMVGATGATPTTRRIGPVYTPPAHRRRGYASAATAAVSQLLLDTGLRAVVLFTDLANPTANHIYQAIGYQALGDRVDVEFSVNEGQKE